MINIDEIIKENENLKQEIKAIKNKEEARKKYFADFAKAQGAFKVNAKNQEVTVISTKDGKVTKYTYKYLTLSELTEIIRKPFADNGIHFTQKIKVNYKNERMAFVTIVTSFRHSSGYEDEPNELVLPAYLTGNQKDIQTLGGVFTYAKRYALQSLVGISADEDDDANEACENTIVKTTPQSPVSPIQNPQAKQRPYCYCFKCKKPLYDKEKADKVKAEYGCFLCETHEKEAEEEANGKKEEARQQKLAV